MSSIYSLPGRQIGREETARVRVEMPPDDLPELIERLRGNDPEAARELVERFGPALRARARNQLRRLGLRHYVESVDIQQVVLRSLLSGLAGEQYSPRNADELMRLIYVQTRNKVIDLYRRYLLRRVLSDATEWLVGEVPSREDGEEQILYRDLLFAVRQRLTDQEAPAFELWLQGETWPEIANRLGQGAEALRKRVERALHRIGDELGLLAEE